jgi:hypothetical protein
MAADVDHVFRWPSSVSGTLKKAFAWAVTPMLQFKSQYRSPFSPADVS